MNVNHLGQIETRRKNLRSLKAGRVCCRQQKGRGLIHSVRRTAFHLQKPGTTGAPIWSPVVPQMLQVANPRRYPQERLAADYLIDSPQTIGGRLSENIQNISRCWFSQSIRGLYLSRFLVYFYVQLFTQSIPFRSLHLTSYTYIRKYKNACLHTINLRPLSSVTIYNQTLFYNSQYVIYPHHANSLYICHAQFVTLQRTKHYLL